LFFLKINFSGRYAGGQNQRDSQTKKTSVNPKFLGRGLTLSLEVLQVDSMVGAHHFTSGDVMDPNPVGGAINGKRWISHAPPPGRSNE
jgi:hypothetical protein